MRISASRSKLFEDVATLIFGLSIAVALWQPDLRWPIWLGIAALLLAVAARPFFDTPADRVRRRKQLWVIPTTFAALAVQLVWTADSTSRLRTVALASLLLVAGVGFYIQRRRAT